MLHVILKARTRLLRPVGVTEFRTAVAGITQVKPFTRVRHGKMERVKGFPRAKAELIKKLKDKAAKLRTIADQTEDKGKIKSYYGRANGLEARARELEEGQVAQKEVKEIKSEEPKEKDWNHDRIREWAKDIARDLIGEVQGGEVSDEMMYQTAKSYLLMEPSIRKYLITDRGLESRQAMAEWLSDEIASQFGKYMWDPKTKKVVSSHDFCPHNGPTLTHSNGDIECLGCNEIIGKRSRK